MGLKPRPESAQAVVARAISERAVVMDGDLTRPRSFGVYQIPRANKAIRLFRYGNHPVRMRELEREFGSASLRHLFLSRQDAQRVAGELNGYRGKS
jgi:hypothetical protein